MKFKLAAAGLVSFLLLAITAQANAEDSDVFAQNHARVMSEIDTIDAPVLKAFIEEIITKLNEGRADADMPLVTIVADDSVNAFTIGRGYIYVHVGLLAVLETEAELAMVIGHELAHGDRNHTSNASLQSTFSTLIALRAARRAKGPISSIVAARLGQKGGSALFSRMQERGADVFGLQYLAAGGYNSEAGIKAMERLKSPITPGLWTRSHPLSEERLIVLSKLSKQYPGGEFVGREPYLQKAHANPYVAAVRQANAK